MDADLRALEDQLKLANELLRRFATCCGSGLDLDVLDDLYAYLEGLDQ